MAAKDDYLLSDLADLGFLTPQQISAAQTEAQEHNEGVVDTLVKNRVIRAQDVTTAKAAHFGVEMISLAETKIPDDALASIPRHIAKRYKVIPVLKHPHSIVVALSDPSDLSTIDSLQHVLHKEIEVRVTSDEEIDAALGKLYGAGDDSVASMIQNITEGNVEVANIKGDVD
ncbi:MAG: type II/IV secretion system protein, partial [Verrucomicrobia bacterium]|nr:type II/IV secretion system protein [Verrucomicrobiota bacterium]